MHPTTALSPCTNNAPLRSCLRLLTSSDCWPSWSWTLGAFLHGLKGSVEEPQELIWAPVILAVSFQSTLFKRQTHCAGPRPSITAALQCPKGQPVFSSSSWHKSNTAERAILGQKGVAVIKLQFCTEKWQYKKCCCMLLFVPCLLDSKCTQCAAEKIFFLNLPLFQS